MSDRFVYSDVDATGFNYARGQVPKCRLITQSQLDLLTNLLAHFKGQATLSGSCGAPSRRSGFLMSDPERVAEILERQPGLLAPIWKVLL